MRACRAPSLVSSSRPSLSRSRRPAGYTPGTSTKSLSVARPSLSGLNWVSTSNGLFSSSRRDTAGGALDARRARGRRGGGAMDRLPAQQGEVGAAGLGGDGVQHLLVRGLVPRQQAGRGDGLGLAKPVAGVLHQEQLGRQGECLVAQRAAGGGGPAPHGQRRRQSG